MREYLSKKGIETAIISLSAASNQSVHTQSNAGDSGDNASSEGMEETMMMMSSLLLQSTTSYLHASLHLNRGLPTVAPVVIYSKVIKGLPHKEHWVSLVQFAPFSYVQERGVLYLVHASGVPDNHKHSSTFLFSFTWPICCTGNTSQSRCN
ncbi:hypothetical protein OS493_000699 [Desmophyllum pertusum]|uniref:Uncharacterized protein n=1 Tax=Desmophyllum pertusum TaxID=174260 RepID=A0A9X0A8R3_9CNID|nr:hypothetical protein OS493_000699 [Desmophyllum pertusum]